MPPLPASTPQPPATDLAVVVAATAVTVRQRKPFAFVVTTTNEGLDPSAATLVTPILRGRVDEAHRP